MEEDYLQILIKKYIEDTATDKEKELLLSWYREKSNKANILPYYSEDDELEARDRLLKNLRYQIAPAKQRSLFILPMWCKIAGVAALLILSIWFVLNKNAFNRKEAVQTQNFVSTRLGEHRRIKLSDGSLVWLSSGSQISYPKHFGPLNREIGFEGEAFFDIAKDKKHPFIIHTSGTSVKVLGTTFNIHSFKEFKNITVALITGKVAFNYQNSQVQLKPGKQIVYNKEKQTASIQRIPDINDVISRRDGLYEYKNITVEAIAADLHKNFNLNVKIEGGVKNCLFYGRKLPQENILQFLQKMTIVVNASLVKINNTYVIRGGGCALK